MRRRLTSFDPLEETVGADDITGRNNCPIWKRISAIGCFAPDQRVSIMNGSRNSDHGMRRLGQDWEAVPCWIEIDGRVSDHKKIKDLEGFVGMSANTLRKHRRLAIERGCKEAITNGKRWGWYNS